MADSKSARRTTVWSLLPSAYVPGALFAVGQGAIVPVLALTALDLGASPSLAALLVALRGVGIVLFDVPAGYFIDRWGERRAMLFGTCVLVGALAGCWFARTPAQFGAAMLLLGAGWAVWLTARLTYISAVMPVHLRARALAVLGGAQRIGALIGPLVGGLVVAAGISGGPYLLHIVTALVGCALLYSFADVPVSPVPDRPSESRATWLRRPLPAGLVAGAVVAVLVSGLRAVVQIVIPLWGTTIGLDAAQISLLFALSAAVDIAVFYPVGWISDRFGRRAVAIPCLSLTGLGLAATSFVNGFSSLLAAALVVGVGNGFGSGLVMTLGADRAPAIGRAKFFGAWRLVSDCGGALAPVVFAALHAGVSLSVGTTGLGLAGIAGLSAALRVRPPRSPDEEHSDA